MANRDDKFLYKSGPIDDFAYKIVMGYPACESFALSSLGYMWLSKLVDENPEFSLSQVFTDSEVLPDKRNIEAISFSLSYEMDFMGLFEILEKLNIPVFSINRSEVFVFAGGPVITSNPMPFAKVFDFMLIGDGEELLQRVLLLLKNNRNLPRNEVLQQLSEMEGVYVPSLNNIATKVTEPLCSSVYTPILSTRAYFSDTFIIEVERGCYNRCGFCLASYLNLPVRYVDYDEIIAKIEFALQYTKNIALLGAQVSAHPRFEDICSYIISKIEAGENLDVNFSSLRVDAVNEKVIKLLKISGQKTFTVAIEAATERLRKVINKNLKEERLFEALQFAYDGGMQGVKVYCMLGLPTETQDDVQAFVDLAKRLKGLYKRFDITFSFSTFVPKPHTPFQWVAREDANSLERKQKFLTKELSKLGVKSKFSSVKWDYYQTLISRGDDGLGEYLYRVYKQGGKLGAYKSVAKELKINTDFYVMRDYSLDEQLPWNNIIIPTPGKDVLKNEYKRLMKKADLG